jgi:hypothetical protein
MNLKFGANPHYVAGVLGGHAASGLSPSSNSRGQLPGGSDLHFVARRTVNEPAWIERATSNILERCTLVNVCEIGARLTITDVYDLPEKFALHQSDKAIQG